MHTYQPKNTSSRQIQTPSAGRTNKSLEKNIQPKTSRSIGESPFVALQRKKIETLFGTSVQREPTPEEEEMLQKKAVVQQKTVQKQFNPEEEELPVQGKSANSAPLQYKLYDEEELPVQSKMEAVQKHPNNTGMPDEVKQKMENSFNSDFSNVKIHANSSKAPQVGALAYTQGHEVHFAPGQFSPNTSSGQQLLGHELAHVVQQREGRVQPTTEVAGMPVNDNPSLENEADKLGEKASKT